MEQNISTKTKMKMSLTNKIIIGFIVCILVIIAVSIFTFKNSEKYIASNAMVNHTNQILFEFEQILVNSVEAESGTRGFIITGSENFLQSFSESNSKVMLHLSKARQLTEDNALQQKNIEELEQEVKLRTDHLKKSIELRKKGFENARELVVAGEGKRIQVNIAAIVNRAKAIEQDLLAERKKTSEDDASNFYIILLVFVALIISILIIVYNIIFRNIRALKQAETENKRKTWLATGNSELNEKLIGDKSVEQLANNTISFFCTYLKANIGAVYLFDDKENALVLSGQYAFSSLKSAKRQFTLNEGLIGQAAWEQKQISMSDVAEDQVHITTSLLNMKPKHLLITPFLQDGKTLGVIELGRLTEFNKTEKEFISISMNSIAISVNTVKQAGEKEKRAAELAVANQELIFQRDEKEKRAAELVVANQELIFQSDEKEKRAAELLAANQDLAYQAEELQAQQEELRQMNEELEEQSQNLKQQQEELQMTNEELEEQTQSLELKNTEVEAAKNNIEQKTKQLEISSKYKSEFLANMSHELRTPLNSLLILSKDLFDNKKKNLDPLQVESAEIIYKSGHDLLLLINEVLDLSKIEAGKMAIQIERISLLSFMNNLIRNFKHQADQKGLILSANLDPELPEFIHTDSQRLNQILKNLLSNAIKFTEKGSVSITINRHTETTINISVTDTGIGIQPDKHSSIFEAFQQADGGTARKYGGTGLGLSISRELARLLEAEITVSSEINKGSTFSLIIPLKINDEKDTFANNVKEVVSFQPRLQDDSKYLNYPSINDDRNSINANDKVVLLIEDDLKFAKIILNQAKEKDFKCIVAATGEDGLALAAKYKPQAIILDMNLPGINGQQVLLELKANPEVKHIPVHIISAKDSSSEPIRAGAVEYLMKPIDKNDLEAAFNRIENFVNREIKNLLIIEDNENARKAIKILIGNENVNCLGAGTGKEALDIYENNQIDCIILDLGLPDISGFDLIHQIKNLKDHNIPPVIVYTGKELTREEHNELQKYSESIIIKGVKSEERLLDETALFLHRTVKNLPESEHLIVNKLYNKEAIFNGKKILLVDDDSRNVFALTKILSEQGVEIVKAENGRIALDMLDTHDNIDMVLMDIMMPEMDGYEAMRHIRAQFKFRKLPVIALTAKAMKDDKQKCIDAGANDYITKPIDVERLLSLMRVWLSK